METLNPQSIAAQLAERLNRDADERNPTHFFKLQEETFKIISHEGLDAGGTKITFEFTGMVINKDEPVTYLASGAITVDAHGNIKPNSIEF